MIKREEWKRKRTEGVVEGEYKSMKKGCDKKKTI